MTTTRSHSMAGAQTRRLPRALVTLCAVNALVALGLGATPAHAAAAQQRPAALKPAALKSAAQPAVAAAGKLAPTGCVAGAVTTDVTCDLYAQVGTTTIVGAPSIPIWGFASTSAGPATIPGPALVVNQGDHVTVTLHNNVPGEHMSLAFPSQPGAPFAGGDDVTGVAAGSTVSYSFTAGSAGTFMYEAGHTSNGARQVAMGLAGALVVLPSDGSAYGVQPAGFPNTSYDDDALLVLSEIDPALNNAPTTFDMRDWSPKYRLVNGNAFPETKTIATDQNHKVLVRYVNIGSNAHSMSVLGREQVEVAADGHASHYSTTLATEAIDPGTTLDTIVTMPSGVDSKFAIYEPSQHSDNNTQHTADPEQLAFGGMIVMLDTNAPPAGSDSVGPVSSHVTVTPKTAAPGNTVTVKADLSDAKTGGSAVAQAEFVIDDPTTTAPGSGTPMTATFGTITVLGASAIIDPAVLSALQSGRHTIYVRALDAATPGNWGVVSSTTFIYAKAGPLTTNVEADANPANGQQGVDLTATGDDRIAGGKVMAAEYFVGAVGADGTGQAMTLNRQTSVAAMTATIPAAVVLALGEGTHPIYVHAQDSHGTWGGTNHVDLIVDLNGPTVQSASVGPNPTNGAIGAKGNPGNLVISASIADGPPASSVTSLLDDAEAFIDPPTATPAEGSGIQLVATDGEMDSSTESVYGLIPLTHIRPLSDGVHTVYVRGHDVAGNWGPLFAVPFTVDKVAPVLGPLAVTFTPTAGVPTTATLSAPLTETSPLSVAEYWIGTTVPAVGKGISTTWTVNTSATVPPVTTVAIDVDLATVLAGNQQFNMRVRDAAGNWSLPVSTVAYVKKNPIFSDNFNSGTLNLWSARTGAVSNVNNALQVSFATPPRAGFVTDTTPLGELTYHAKFTFTPVGLTGGGVNPLTIFSARDTANRQVFSVQYRLNGTAPEVRIVLSRNAPLTEVGGLWWSFTPGQTIQVDWAAGSNGSLALLTNNVVRETLAGLNSARQVDTVLLGVSTGQSLTTAGTASFDNFVSVRSTF